MLLNARQYVRLTVRNLFRIVVWHSRLARALGCAWVLGCSAFRRAAVLDFIYVGLAESAARRATLFKALTLILLCLFRKLVSCMLNSTRDSTDVSTSLKA